MFATTSSDFDIFGTTDDIHGIVSRHIETVVLLSREKVDGHISIALDVEKLESKSGTATYAEIKAYIKERYGLSVSSLYIGQIKDKAGIKERKNYNTGIRKRKGAHLPA